LSVGIPTLYYHITNSSSLEETTRSNTRRRTDGQPAFIVRTICCMVDLKSVTLILVYSDVTIAKCVEYSLCLSPPLSVSVSLSELQVILCCDHCDLKNNDGPSSDVLVALSIYPIEKNAFSLGVLLWPYFLNTAPERRRSLDDPTTRNRRSMQLQKFCRWLQMNGLAGGWSLSSHYVRTGSGISCHCLLPA
jgi:hypothetical protein